jgi:hypothetical protein
MRRHLRDLAVERTTIWLVIAAVMAITFMVGFLSGRVPAQSTSAEADNGRQPHRGVSVSVPFSATEE